MMSQIERSSTDDRTQLRQLMQEFGFEITTAQTYTLLLADGPHSLVQLGSIIHEPAIRIKHALQQLLRLRLVGTDNQRGQVKYYCTDPLLAWLALIADLVWGTRTSLQPIRNLPEATNPNIENLRMICAEVSRVAEQLYKPQAAAISHKERDAESPEELAQLICEIIYQARNDVLAISKSPRLPQVSSFWAVLTNRIDNGTHYHRVIDIEEIIDHGLGIVSRDIEAMGIDLKVLEQSQIRQKFYVVDHKFLAVFHQADEGTGIPQKGVGRVTNQRQIVDRYRKRFKQYSELAIPGRFVVGQMRRAAENLIQQAKFRLLPIEVEWLKDVIEYGKFSKFHLQEDWSSQHFALVEQRARDAGIVRRNSDGDIVPVYPTNEISIRAAYVGAGGPLLS